MASIKRIFYREGRTYSMITMDRRNMLAGYSVSRNGKIIYYQIFTISVNADGIEYLIGSDDHQIETYDIFLNLWEIMNRTRNKKQTHENN